MIKEIIVVEGRDDITAVKRAVDAEVIETHGFGYGKKLIDTLQKINKTRGIIIFTDPDYMGNKIRRDLNSKLKNVKNAFLTQEEARKNNNIGIENASEENIKKAIELAKPNLIEKTNIFNRKILFENNLIDTLNSNERREKICKLLRIGHCNGKQFMNKLNRYGITMDEFEKALEMVNNG